MEQYETSSLPAADGAAQPAGDANAFLADVLEGLRTSPKNLPSRYLYDATGSALFDQICKLDEYYPTRTELGILRSHAAEMAACLGRDCVLIEYGSGSSNKTDPILTHLPRPALYAPVDVAREHLLAAADRIARAFPDIHVCPVHADFTSRFQIPEPSWTEHRRAVYFPGSTIGNFTLADAERLLMSIASVCGRGGALLVGVDLQKPRDVLERAYNDADGVTAAFNLNLLARLNRELGADFDLARFRHRARWNEPTGRVEMHLESMEPQTVHVAGERFPFRAGETICTEYSHKFTLGGFRELVEGAGFEVRQSWTDERAWFSVQYCEVP